MRSRSLGALAMALSLSSVLSTGAGGALHPYNDGGTGGPPSPPPDPYAGGGTGGPPMTGASANASTGSGWAAPAAHKAAAHHSVHGTVASVDATAKSFTVHPKTGADVVLKVNDKTTFWVGKTKGSWDDVKQGATVTSSYHLDGTDNWALSVKVAPEKAAGSAAKTGK